MTEKLGQGLSDNGLVLDDQNSAHRPKGICMRVGTGAPHDLSEAERNVAVTIARQLGFSLERGRAEEQRSLLMQELNHRVKNTLATVQSLALQTFGAHQRMEDATAIFQARLIALANAHDVLTQQNWSGADLPDIVHRIVDPFRLTSSRIATEGPTVWLSPRQALAIGMALHEGSGVGPRLDLRLAATGEWVGSCFLPAVE